MNKTPILESSNIQKNINAIIINNDLRIIMKNMIIETNIGPPEILQLGNFLCSNCQTLCLLPQENFCHKCGWILPNKKLTTLKELWISLNLNATLQQTTTTSKKPSVKEQSAKEPSAKEPSAKQQDKSNDVYEIIVNEKLSLKLLTDIKIFTSQVTKFKLLNLIDTLEHEDTWYQSIPEYKLRIFGEIILYFKQNSVLFELTKYNSLQCDEIQECSDMNFDYVLLDTIETKTENKKTTQINFDLLNKNALPQSRFEPDSSTELNNDDL